MEKYYKVDVEEANSSKVYWFSNKDDYVIGDHLLVAFKTIDLKGVVLEVKEDKETIKLIDNEGKILFKIPSSMFINDFSIFNLINSAINDNLEYINYINILDFIYDLDNFNNYEPGMVEFLYPPIKNENLFNIVIKNLKAISDKSFDIKELSQVVKRIDRVFRQNPTYRIYGTGDAINNYINNNVESFNLDILFEFGNALVYQSMTVEGMKLGLTLLTPYERNIDEETILDYLKISMISEFTFYVGYMMENVLNKKDFFNHLLFKTTGFGEIIVLESLDYDKDLKKLVVENFDEESSDHLKAIVIKEKINLEKYLTHRCLSKKEVSGVSGIVSVLSTNYSVKDKKIYENFIERLEDFKDNLAYLKALLKIKNSLEDFLLKEDLDKINSFFKGDEFKKIVNNKINKNDLKDLGEILVMLNIKKFNKDLFYLFNETSENKFLILKILLKDRRYKKKMLEEIDEVYKTLSTKEEELEFLNLLKEYPFKGLKSLVLSLKKLDVSLTLTAIESLEEWEKNIKK